MHASFYAPWNARSSGYELYCLFIAAVYIKQPPWQTDASLCGQEEEELVHCMVHKRQRKLKRNYGETVTPRCYFTVAFFLYKEKKACGVLRECYIGE